MKSIFMILALFTLKIGAIDSKNKIMAAKSKYVHVTCESKNKEMCSDTSILRFFMSKFVKECKNRDGILKENSTCDKSQYQSSYCTISDLNFQIYYSKSYSKKKAMSHCAKQSIGPYSLTWVEGHK